jgi:hypothetical protein
VSFLLHQYNSVVANLSYVPGSGLQVQGEPIAPAPRAHPKLRAPLDRGKNTLPACDLIVFLVAVLLQFASILPVPYTENLK